MSARDPYAARHAFFDPARGRSTVRGVILGLVGVEAAWLAAGSLLMPWPETDTGTAARTLAAHLPFLAILAATAFVVRRIQGRDPRALIGPPAGAGRDFLKVAGTLAVLFAVLYAIPGGWEGVTQARPIATWLFLLPLGCAAVLLQTGAEEVLYRGYLQQSLGGRIDNRAVWMVLPSLLFGVSHYNPEIAFDATLSHMIWATGFGLAAADLTARTGTLGAAMGMHFALNLPLVVLIATPGELSGLALMHDTSAWSEAPQSAIRLGFDLFYLWMIWMACRIAVRR